MTSNNSATASPSALARFEQPFEHELGGQKYWVSQLSLEPYYALMRNQGTGKYLIAEYSRTSWVERSSCPGAWDVVDQPSVSPMGQSQTDAQEALRWLERRLANTKKK